MAMYIPSQFREQDRATLVAFMREHGFATLVSNGPTGLIASHVPLLVDDEDGRVAIRGHVARANPHWRDHDGRALAIFSGPHCYISSAWYDADNTVPTWNYQAVHAAGTLELIEDEAGVARFFADLAAAYEGAEARLWQERLSAESFAAFSKQIVCFRIEVDDLQGKWKLNQHHPAERRRKVIAELRRLGGEDREAIARAMESTLSDGVGGPPPR
jgi:transcriptional regulator